MGTRELVRGLRVIAAATLLTSGLAAVADAAVLVKYEFTGGTQAPTYVDSNVSASDFTPSNGLKKDLSFTDSGAEARGWNTKDRDEAVTKANGNNATFWEFTVTAEPGLAFNLESIKLTQSSGTEGPTNFSIGLFDGSKTNWISNSISTAGGLELTVALVPDVSLTGLTSAIIRIAAWGAANNGVPSSHWTVDDIQVNGDVVAATSVVPEPASFALLSIGTLGLAGVAARRRAREAKAGK